MHDPHRWGGAHSPPDHGLATQVIRRRVSSLQCVRQTDSRMFTAHFACQLTRLLLLGHTRLRVCRSSVFLLGLLPYKSVTPDSWHPHPVIRLAISPRTFPLLLESGIRNQDLA